MPAIELAPSKLQRFRDQCHRATEEKQPRVRTRSGHGNFQIKQRRSEAEAINANQQPGLDLGNSLQKPLEIACERDTRRNEQKRVNWDKNAKQLIGVIADKDVLKWREECEHPE